MRVFSVIGYSKTGKTTTIEEIVRELRKRGYSVGTVKDIYCEDFKIDMEGTNTYRHRQAGSQLVCARGPRETDVMFQEKLDIYKVLSFFDHDYVILEGVSDINAPKVVTAETPKDIDDKLDFSTFLISGKIADTINEYKGIKAISALGDIVAVADCIEDKVFDILPDFKGDCCSACGYSCRKMCELILREEKKRSDCMLNTSTVSLKINGNEISMVPFVQKILRNSIMAVISELDGYQKNSDIKIKLKV